MKAEKEKRGMLSVVWATATHNWGLKIVALALAIIVYVSLKPNNDTHQEPNGRHLIQDK